EPRSPDRPALPGEPNQLPEPDRERSAGTGPSGSASLFADRIAAERRRRQVSPRRGQGTPPPSHAARVKAPCGSRHLSLFDGIPDLPSSPAPPGALGDATGIGPPDLASRYRTLTLLPACPGADTPGPGADPFSCPEAPAAGPDQQGGDHATHSCAQRGL